MANDLQLYPHQLPSVAGLRQGFVDGHRAQILMAPTGFGKTIVAAHLLDITAKNGKRAAILVDRKNLVDQTSAVLDKYGIDHGVVQADHWRKRLYERVQVCSAQTIEKRGFFPDLNLLIVDECHEMRAGTIEFIKSNPKIRVIGLSATPFSKGLAGIYSNLVNVCTTNELLAMGELAPLKAYAAKKIDMSGAKVEDGEWTTKETGDRGMKIVGDIVAEWRQKTMEHFGGPVKTIVFAASIAHGAELCRQFAEAGFNFQQIVGKSGADESERDQFIQEFRRPDSSIVGLISCEIFTKGFDVPDIMCGISARPYRKSLSNHIQQMGRVMRKHPGKAYGLWLDHSGNLMRFRRDAEEVFEHGLDSLEDGNKRDAAVRAEPTEKEHETWSCACGFVFPRPMDACPSCGKERSKRNMVENVAGVMEAVGHGAESAKDKTPNYLADKAAVWRQLCSIAHERKKEDHEAARRFAQRQHMDLFGHFSRVPYSPEIGEPASDELRGKVTSNIIRFSKAQGRRKTGAEHAVR